jgi:TPR repeat protein
MSKVRKWLIWGFAGVPLGALTLLFVAGVLIDAGVLPERLPWHAQASETAGDSVTPNSAAPAPLASAEEGAKTPMGTLVAQHWTESWLRTYEVAVKAFQGDKKFETQLNEILAHCKTMDECTKPENAFAPISDALADFITAHYFLGRYFFQRAEATGDINDGKLAFEYWNIATLFKHPLGTFSYAGLREVGKYSEKDINSAYGFYLESGQAGYLPGALRAAKVASDAKSWRYAREAMLLALQYPVTDDERAEFENELRNIEFKSLNTILVTAEELPRNITLF